MLSVLGRLSALQKLSFEAEVTMEASTRGAYIRGKRRAKGWNQDDLAEEVGVSRNTVSGWETDKYDISIGNAKALAQALDVELLEIIAGKDLPDMDEATKKALEREINKLSDQIDNVQSVTINIEDRGIVSLDIALSALAFAFFATAMGIWAAFAHTTPNMICIGFFALVGVVVLIFGRTIVKKLDKQLKERSEKNDAS